MDEDDVECIIKFGVFLCLGVYLDIEEESVWMEGGLLVYYLSCYIVWEIGDNVFKYVVGLNVV